MVCPRIFTIGQTVSARIWEMVIFGLNQWYEKEPAMISSARSCFKNKLLSMNKAG